MRVNWVEEEIRLLLKFYSKMQSGDMHKSHPLVLQASCELKRLSINEHYTNLDPNFRNPNGVSLKLANFLYLDPKYPGKGMKGCSKLDKKIFNEYLNSSIQTVKSELNRSENLPFINLIDRFISLLHDIGEKGSPMGSMNKFNGLAHQLNITYAGSTIKPVSKEFLYTSPVISFGLGRFSAVPWIAFAAHEQEIRRGIYPVVLFFLEEDAVILSYGVSETQDQIGMERVFFNRIEKNFRRITFSNQILK